MFTTYSDYSYKKSLRFKSVQEENEGKYECRGRHVLSEDNFDSEFISLFVHGKILILDL